MAQAIINLGTAPNAGDGDSLRAGGQKANDNFTELYGRTNPLGSPTYAGLLLTGLAAAGIVWAGVGGALGAVPAQAANAVYIGPASGGAAAPGFRALSIADLPLVGQANGLATLDAGGKVPTAQLPALAITETFVVASQAAMLALSAERGDVAVRSDLTKSFILATDSPGTLADWKELLTPTDAVLSVAGLTGVISSSSLKTALDLSGVNTGDQTITLTGDVTGSGAGSFATAIGATKVTSAMLNADVYSIAHSWGGQQTFVAPILGVATGTSLTLTASSAASVALTVNDAPAHTANLVEFLRSDGLLLASIGRGSDSYGRLTIGGASAGAYVKLGGDNALSIDNGSTAVFRLLGAGNDIFIQNTVTAGNIYFGAYGGGALTGKAYVLAAALGIGRTDVLLVGETANILAQRNGPAPQAFNVYRTWTDASNYERLRVGVWAADSSVFAIEVQQAGAGTARPLVINSAASTNIHFYTGTTGRWNIQGATGHLFAEADNTVDIGGSVSARPRNIYVANNIVAGGGISAGAYGATVTAANTAAFTSTGYSLTGANAQSLIDLAGTWNTSGTPTAIKLNITNTASNAASLLMDLQKGSVSQFKVDHAGVGTFATGIAVSVGGSTTPSLSFGPTGSGFFFDSGQTRLGFNNSGNIVFAVSSDVVGLRSSAALAWANTTTPHTGGSTIFDLNLWRGGGGILEQYNGGNAQSYKLFNTRTDASNGEWLQFGFSSNIPYIITNKNGTGVERSLQLGSGGAVSWEISGGTLRPILDSTRALGDASHRITSVYTSALFLGGAIDAGGASLVNSGLAIPAGGQNGAGYKFSSTANFGTFFGSGAPTLSAAKGSLYLRSNGTGTGDRAYINTDGGTTWTALTTAA